jgi:hypothetical protein
MKIKINQIFRYSTSGQNKSNCEYAELYELTKGAYSTGVGAGGKGIFNYAQVTGPEGVDRIPAIILHSNPLKEGTDLTPWVDFIDHENGYAIYNGDNKSSSTSAYCSTGNKLIQEVYPLYLSEKSRNEAPPILLFKQELVNGRRKGYRSFLGYGVPKSIYIRTQKNSASGDIFSNLVYEIVLFSLDKEEGLFNWEWINDRRNILISSKNSNQKAPYAWKEWVKKGVGSLNELQNDILKNRLTKTVDQKVNSLEHKQILNTIYKYYKNRKHHFEALASLVCAHSFGAGKITRGWITQQSSDGGVDFVSKMELGKGFGKTSLVILGQAKCIKTSSLVSGKDLARVVARLQRGWIGVFVTTGVFSEKCQREVFYDKYPLVLINGMRLAEEIKEILRKSDQSLQSLLLSQTDWYSENIKPFEPAFILNTDTLRTKA